MMQYNLAEQLNSANRENKQSPSAWIIEELAKKAEGPVKGTQNEKDGNNLPSQNNK